VLNAFRNDEHLSGRDAHGTISKIDAQIALEYDERLVPPMTSAAFPANKFVVMCAPILSV
jgi:hypothetical protein